MICWYANCGNRGRDAQTAEYAAGLIEIDYEVYEAVTSEKSKAATNANAESFRKTVTGGLPYLLSGKGIPPSA